MFSKFKSLKHPNHQYVKSRKFTKTFGKDYRSIRTAGADPGIKLTAAQHRKQLRKGRGSKLAGCHA